MSEDNLEVVSQAMMDELNRFGRYGSHSFLVALFQDDSVCNRNLRNWLEVDDYSNKAFLTLAKHFNGDPQFKAEKTKKWIVRSKDNNFYLAEVGLSGTFTGYAPDSIKFDTKEEAENWTNPQTEVVEVEG